MDTSSPGRVTEQQGQIAARCDLPPNCRMTNYGNQFLYVIDLFAPNRVTGALGPAPFYACSGAYPADPN
jgi:hypothetical protein